MLHAGQRYVGDKAPVPHYEARVFFRSALFADIAECLVHAKTLDAGTETRA